MQFAKAKFYKFNSSKIKKLQNKFHVVMLAKFQRHTYNYICTVSLPDPNMPKLFELFSRKNDNVINKIKKIFDLQ